MIDGDALTPAQEAAVAYIRLRCEVCPACGERWLWTGQSNGNGHPKVYSRSVHKWRPARREVWELTHGVPLGRRVVSTECAQRMCLNPVLLKATTRAAVSTATAARADVAQRRRVSMAATMRQQHAKLDMAKAREVRASKATGKALAARYGVSEDLISKVRNGKAWCELVSPFSGMGGR